MNRKLTIVIRTAGERTAAICCQLLARQVPWATIEVVNERPFEAALRKTYQIGISHGAPWTMTIDGDVLIRRGAVEKFLAAAEEMPSHFVQIEGRIHDKLVGNFRQAGHRIYRTALLPKALALLPSPGEEIRPEFSILHKLVLLGHPLRRIEMVVGIHDYQQYYRDIYRKAFVHAKKHPELIPHFVARAKTLMHGDADFLVLLRGLWKGLDDAGPVGIDVTAFTGFDSILAGMGLHEKPELRPGTIGFDHVEQALQDAGPAERVCQYNLESNGEWMWGPLDPAPAEPPQMTPSWGAAQRARMAVGSFLRLLEEQLRHLISRRKQRGRHAA